MGNNYTCEPKRRQRFKFPGKVLSTWKIDKFKKSDIIRFCKISFNSIYYECLVLSRSIKDDEIIPLIKDYGELVVEFDMSHCCELSDEIFKYMPNIEIIDIKSCKQVLDLSKCKHLRLVRTSLDNHQKTFESFNDIKNLVVDGPNLNVNARKKNIEYILDELEKNENLKESLTLYKALKRKRSVEIEESPPTKVQKTSE